KCLPSAIFAEHKRQAPFLQQPHPASCLPGDRSDEPEPADAGLRRHAALCLQPDIPQAYPAPGADVYEFLQEKTFDYNDNISAQIIPQPEQQEFHPASMNSTE